MDDEKKKRLESTGWVVTDAANFLNDGEYYAWKEARGYADPFAVLPSWTSAVTDDWILQQAKRPSMVSILIREVGWRVTHAWFALLRGDCEYL